ncbi:MAG: hypothetical protein V8K32_00675 [Candidatus Electrothrix gigas]
MTTPEEINQLNCHPDLNSEKNGAKALLKEGRVEEVKESLKPHLEPEETEDQHAPVRSCLCYLDNRPGQFDYLIGSLTHDGL